jgi:hypothetical protein
MLRIQAIGFALLVTIAFGALASVPYFALRYEDQIADLRAQIDRMSKLDQERVKEIKSLVQRQATLEQVISRIAKARNDLPASFYDRFEAGYPSSPIETTSAIPHVGSAEPEATTNDKKIRPPPRKQAPVVRRQTQEAPTVAEDPNASRPAPASDRINNARGEMQNY